MLIDQACPQLNKTKIHTFPPTSSENPDPHFPANQQWESWSTHSRQPAVRILIHTFPPTSSENPDPSTTLKRSRSGKAPDSTGSRTSPYFLKYIYINILKTTLKGTSHLTCLYCTIKGSASLNSTLADSCIQNCKWKLYIFICSSFLPGSGIKRFGSGSNWILFHTTGCNSVLFMHFCMHTLKKRN